MNANRFFAIFVSGLLVVDERRFDETDARLAPLCALDQAEVQRGTGPGDSVRNGDRLAVRQWIQEQRADGVTSVAIAVQDGSAEARHERASAARVQQKQTGLVDGLPILMRVDTRHGGPVHVQGTVPGPRLSLTAPLFLELLNQQDEADFLRPGVLTEVNGYRAHRDLEDIAASDLPSYLLSPAGAQGMDAVRPGLCRLPASCYQRREQMYSASSSCPEPSY